MWDEFKRLLKENFELFVKKCWLKEIDKAMDEYTKAFNKAHRKKFVVHELVHAYNEKYGYLFKEELWQ